MKNRISELRKLAGMTQTDLAEKLRVQQSTLSHWENGVYDIDTETLVKLSATFDVSIDYILCNERNLFAEKLTAYLQNDNALHQAILKKYGMEILQMIQMFNKSSMPRQADFFKLASDIDEHGITKNELSLISSVRTFYAMEGNETETATVRNDNYEELSDLMDLLKNVPPEKLKILIEIVEKMK